MRPHLTADSCARQNLVSEIANSPEVVKELVSCVSLNSPMATSLQSRMSHLALGRTTFFFLGIGRPLTPMLSAPKNECEGVKYINPQNNCYQYVSPGGCPYPHGACLFSI